MTTATIPDYRDVYRHPPMPCPDNPPFKSTISLDLDKTKGLYDENMNLRYKVIFQQDIYTEGTGDQLTGYNITVLKVDEEQPVEVDHYPSDKPYESKYEVAMHWFNIMVERYQSLLKAEVKGFVDMSVYKDKIGYEVLQPSCCINCAYCRPAIMAPFNGGQRPKYQCHNPDNTQKFNYMVAKPQMPCNVFHKCPRVGSWQKLPWQKYVPNYGFEEAQIMNELSVFPTVEALGTCKNFLSCSEHQFDVDASNAYLVPDPL